MATELYELKQHLRKLVNAIEYHLATMDVVMKQPSTPERGKEIAELCNGLELRKDVAKRFGLGKTPKRKKGKAKK